MEIKDVVSNYRIVKLTPQDNLDEFSCGLKDMDDFLKEDAINQQNDNLNVTYLAKYDDEIIGFFSLLSDSIEVQSLNDNHDVPYDVCPAIKIGRLAINQKYRRNGLGTLLLDDICFEIKNLSEKVGIRFITVDSYCKVRSFYYKNGFNYFKIQNKNKLIRSAIRNDKTTIPLYKDIMRI